MNSYQFRAKIRKSLANENLQVALDANAERRFKGRLAALESLPNWQQRRQRAHAIRADVIEHLDEYLEQFLRNAAKNGIIIHRAQDANDAVKIVLDIAAAKKKETSQQVDTHTGAHTTQDATPSTLIAKSKSMVSEEINLNHALEAEGLKVVETDLGEYIVQLRGEKPAHIITPAVHLRREDVGKLFHEKLDIEYTEDIPTLVNTARQVLREVFLTAQVGVSGVNFGIAEQGAICVVSNEGNARMVTTLPKIHIALMGMERLVRSLDDLAIMLSLLARSATTQKLSVYTQIIHAPQQGQQRHLVLLDNGRTRIRNSPLKESLYCIRCGACLNACPVFREIGGHAYVGVSGASTPYSGPIGSVISAGFFGSDFVPLAQASSLCGACREACPVDIDLPQLLTRVRAGQIPITNSQLPTNGLSSLSTFFVRIYSRVARSPRLFALSQKFAALGTFLAAPLGNYVRLPAFTSWGYSKDLPRFAGKTFRERWDGIQVNRETGIQVDTETSKPVDTYTGKQVDRYTGTQVDTETSTQIGSGSKTPLVSRFAEELAKVNGEIIQTNANEVTDKVIEFLHSRAVEWIHLEPSVLDESVLAKAGIAFSRAPDPAIRVGVTKAICGLADTGSILEADGEGSPLHASLLPEIHLAVLRVSDIHPSLDDAIHLVRGTKSAAFITGPSRTADIEMSLTIGAHGPGEVLVFLVDE